MRTTSAALRRGDAALVAVAVVAAFAAGWTRIADPDFWWHLKAGYLTLETRSIPRVDPFSFTAAGREYIDHEWGFQVLQSLIHRFTGLPGIVIAKCLVIAATSFVAARYAIARGADRIATVGVMLVAVAAALPRLIERPEIFSTLFLLLTLIVVDAYRRHGDARLLILLPLLSFVWANIHAAVVLGVVLQLVMIVGAAIERGRTIVPQAMAATASIIAAGLNPFGYRVLTVPFELVNLISSGVVQNPEWAPTWTGHQPFFWLALLLGIALVAWRMRMSEAALVLVFAFTAYLSIHYIRNVGLLAALLPVLVAPALALVTRRIAAGLLALGCVSLVLATTVAFPGERGIGPASHFPVVLARYVRQANLRGPMYNSIFFGGYLIWSLYPERRVFIDGRNEVYAPLLERLSIAGRDDRAWRSLLSDYRIEYAIVEFEDGLKHVTVERPGGRRESFVAPGSSLRFPRSEWALVEWDDAGMVFVRRRGINGAAAAREYRTVVPEGEGFMRALVDAGRADRRIVIAEIERKLREQPDCRRAARLLAELRGR